MEIVLGYWDKSPDNVKYISYTHCKNIIMAIGLLSFEYLDSTTEYHKKSCYEKTTGYTKFRIPIDKIDYIHIYS